MSKLYRRFCFTLFLVSVILPFYSPTYSSQLTKPASRSIAIAKPIVGRLEIRIEDYLNNKLPQHKMNVIQYVLHSDDSNVYSLIFTDGAPTNLKTGQRITVSNGMLKQNTNPHSSHSKELIVTKKSVIVTRNLTLDENPTTMGKQNTLVMLVNFQNQPTLKPWTQDDVKKTIATVNDMYYEFSYKQTTVGGDVVGWYTLPMSSQASCDDITNALPGLAQQAAKSAGVDLSQYTHLIYMFPQASNCAWAGLGDLGGHPGNIWINGVNNPPMTAHEMGHNLGLYHSHSLDCQNSVNQGTCSQVEYGDYADTMGAVGGPHFNAYQKEHIGWLNFTTSPPIQTVTTTGTYTIDAYESANSNVKALKIEMARTQNTRNYYYVEFRQGTGFDSGLGKCTDCDFTKGVIVHQGNDTNFNSSNILDMSPTDGNKSKKVVLMPGMSFTDVNALNGGITLFVESVSSAGARVKVTFGSAPPPACVQAAPTIAIGPGYAKVTPGQSQTFSVWVKNNNNAACAPASFTFTVAKIHDLIPVTWNPQMTTIASGGSQEISVIASTTTSSPLGYYSVRIDAVNTAAPQYNTFTVGSLVVAAEPSIS